ncbi:hypothetical protein AVEN_69576-1 [Araneus ventricosus]|uniref:Uncharacterized protein n=1 Tax=Araneus ventricosus TaxID=182803 RepID=A0A4Y2H9G4_ARAVE|nr:hypothetical protein AVEN_69576-1 [Araneus ventricosus]
MFGTLNFVAFFATPYFAAEVSREDEKIRKRMKSVAFDLSLSKDTKGQGDLLRRLICVQSKEEITLSAVKKIPFHGNILVCTKDTSSGMLQHSVQDAGKKTPIKPSTEHNSLEMNGGGPSAER